jgi:hypothetical protein
MLTLISTCRGCNCEIINERLTKGRLKKWCSDSCRHQWRYKNDPNYKSKQIQRNTYERQKKLLTRGNGKQSKIKEESVNNVVKIDQQCYVSIIEILSKKK